MLEVSDIDAYYGETQVLFGVDLSVEQGEVVSIVGRNGVGKTTTLRSILNLAEVKDGAITFRGEEITGEDTQDIAKRGIGYAPEERDIFAGLTVRENLKMAATSMSASRTAERMESVTERFPKLRELYESKGGHLSGGEQQMLTIARALMEDNDIILIDEPTEGLAPRIAEDVRDAIADLKGEKTVLLVEQSTKLVYELSDRIYGMVDGEVVYEGTPDDAEESGRVKELLTIQ
ncbi:ABC transporter ATP-binding protein [Halobacterium wangiae]|uniref:ABC transporter ATP-binding protein n=1 Tax=Halobacterium wangiae TaxID=2902623 RepID=UPI001E320B8D|nr:ABC transporter ATP-binding protein [Halobacterium wangiae]